jgi:streptogramin lyase
LGVKAAADGNVYFTESGPSLLGRVVQGFGAAPVEVTVAGQPTSLVDAPDGNLYFLESGSRKIGRIPLGFSPSTPDVESGLTSGTQLAGIRVGPDGRIWFTETGGNLVGRLNTDFAPGTTPTEFALPAGANPEGIATGVDGYLYVAESGINKIAKVSLTGAVTQLTSPTAGGMPYGIAAGADGNVWYTEQAANQIARIHLPGNPKVSNEYPIPTPGSGTQTIAGAKDGSLYFVEVGANKIGKVTAAGFISEFTVPTANAFTSAFGGGISVGTDGFLYFTETNQNRIARVKTNFDPTTFTEVQLASGSNPDGLAAASDGKVYFGEYGPYSGSTAPSKLGWLPLGFATTTSPVEVSIPGNVDFVTPGTDGNLYFTAYYGNVVGHIPLGFTSGSTYVEAPTGAQPTYLAVDKTGNIWFPEQNSNAVATIAKGFTSGTTVTAYALPSGSNPIAIARGSDGKLYVTEHNLGLIVQVSVTGAMKQISPLTANSGPWGITAGADGNVWFVEQSPNNIGKILLKNPPFDNVLGGQSFGPASGSRLPNFNPAPTRPGNRTEANLDQVFAEIVPARDCRSSAPGELAHANEAGRELPLDDLTAVWMFPFRGDELDL